MNTKEQFDLLQNSPETESEVVPKPFLNDKRQVKAHLQLHFPANTWNSRTVQNAIRHWKKKGGIILRCRHPRVANGEWQCISVAKLSGELPASSN